MKFSYLEDAHEQWSDVLAIGRTIERDGKKYHMVGMTLGESAELYIIEPYEEQENRHRRKGMRNQRRLLKENEGHEECYLHCSEFCFGTQWLHVQSGSAGPLEYSVQNYRTIQLFLDMMSAGWVVPEWLKEEEWDNLQLVTLEIADLDELPEYSPEMPIIIKHRPDFKRHLLEKAVTLNVGKSRSFSFVDHRGDKVWCYINTVALMDVWKDTEEQFSNPEYIKKVSPEQLKQAKEHCYRALEQSCPKGMCYIGVEYECSKDISLQFYSKEYLKSRPEHHKGSASFLMMRLKPDKDIGIHKLPLKGCVIQTPVSPDTVQIFAELFLYFEKTEEWEEHI